MFDGTALRPRIPRITLECTDSLAKCKDDFCLKHTKSIHAVYIDDLCEFKAFKLKEDLVREVPSR